MPKTKPEGEIELPEFDLPDMPDLPDLDLFPEEDEPVRDPKEQIEAEIAHAESEFSARAKVEAMRFEEATDSEFWFAVCFQTRAQKDAFIDAMGWRKDLGDKYLDGVEVARRLGVQIERKTVARRTRPHSQKLKALADTE